VSSFGCYFPVPVAQFDLIISNAESHKLSLTKEENMKRIVCILVVAVFLICISGLAKPKLCEELKGEIEEKLKANGVTDYVLEIVPADQIKDQKVVGSCDGGKMKITYTKEQAKEKKQK